MIVSISVEVFSLILKLELVLYLTFRKWYEEGP